MELASTAQHSNITDTALVLEGGGMRASYTAGLVVSLLEQNILFDFVAGISAGSTLAVNYVAQDPLRTRRSFVEFAGDPRLGSWWTWLQGHGVLNSKYIYEDSCRSEGVLPFDFQVYRDNPAQIQLGGFKMATGRTVWWDKEATSTEAALMRRVRASSTIPILMPKVNVNGELFLDGAFGIDGGVPLSTALEHGYEKLLVVMTREESYWKDKQRFEPVIRSWFPRYPAVIDAMLTRHERYNETKEKLFELRDQGKAYLFIPEVMPVSSGTRDLRLLRETYERGYRQAQRELPAIQEFLDLR